MRVLRCIYSGFRSLFILIRASRSCKLLSVALTLTLTFALGLSPSFSPALGFGFGPCFCFCCCCCFYLSRSRSRSRSLSLGLDRRSKRSPASQPISLRLSVCLSVDFDLSARPTTFRMNLPLARSHIYALCDLLLREIGKCRGPNCAMFSLARSLALSLSFSPNEPCAQCKLVPA